MTGSACTQQNRRHRPFVEGRAQCRPEGEAWTLSSLSHHDCQTKRSRGDSTILQHLPGSIDGSAANANREALLACVSDGLTGSLYPLNSHTSSSLACNHGDTDSSSCTHLSARPPCHVTGCRPAGRTAPSARLTCGRSSGSAPASPAQQTWVCGVGMRGCAWVWASRRDGPQG